MSVLLLFALFYNQVRAQDQVNVLIVYYSSTGHTKTMAEAVATGARSVAHVTVTLKTVQEVTNADLLAADAIIVGSPVYNANVAPQVQEFINKWPFDGSPLKDKIGAAFVSAGGMSAGEELTQMNILHSMLVFGMIVVGGPDWEQPFGASAITNEDTFGKVSQDGHVDEIFIRKGKALGARVASLATRMKRKD